MRRSSNPCSHVVLCSLAVLALLGAFQAADARTSVPLFCDGSTTGALERTAWFATYGGQFFGTLVDADGTASDRLFSRRIARGAYRGTVFNQSNKAIGAFSGTQSAAGVSGQYTVTGSGGGTGAFSGTPVVRDSAGMRDIAGTYTSPELRAKQIDLSLRFTASGALTGAAYATSGSLRLKVASLTARFITDSDGFLWILTQKASFAKLSGTTFPIPRQGVPIKLGYHKSGRQLELIDPFDDTRVLATLVRK